LRGVVHAHGVELDGDAALTLEVECVQHLRLHFPLLQRTRLLDQSVGERRLPMIDMGDDAEVADVIEIHRCPGEDVRRSLPKIATRTSSTNR
jgi:hypothetical protein